jgi:hypothetical protein
MLLVSHFSYSLQDPGESLDGYFTILSPASHEKFRSNYESCTKVQIISHLRDSSSETFISHLYMAADGNSSAVVQEQADNPTELIHAII